MEAWRPVIGGAATPLLGFSIKKERRHLPRYKKNGKEIAGASAQGSGARSFVSCGWRRIAHRSRGQRRLRSPPIFLYLGKMTLSL